MKIVLLAPLLVAAVPAHAYIGPGVGAGTIAIVLGILVSIVFSFVAIIWYPVKRLLKKKRKTDEKLDADTSRSPDNS